MSVPVSSLPEEIRFGIYAVDVRAGELRKTGTRVKLEARPFQILTMLLERPGGVVTREELRSRLWPDGTFVDFDHSINSAVRKLRDALCDSASSPRYVETVGRRGYRFVYPVDRLSPSNGSPAPNAQTIDLRPVTTPARAVDTRWLAGIAICLTLMLAVGGMFYTRQAAPPTARNIIVLGNFENRTGDSVFDDTLKQALAAKLQQSPFLNVASDERIDATLRLMGRSPASAVTPNLASDLCQRVGASAVVAGSIAPLGNHYAISLHAVSCATSESLDREEEEAQAKEQVLSALDRATSRLRRSLGESLASIAQFDAPAEQVTTPSLAALKAYSAGHTSRIQNGDASAIPFLDRALEMDPQFAAAYTELGTAYFNLKDQGLAMKSMQRAYELRARLSEREQLSVEARYFTFVTGEVQKSNAAYSVWAQTYANDSIPLVDLGCNQALLGNYEAALQSTLQAIHRDPESRLAYANLIGLYTSLGRLPEAKATYDLALRRNLEHPGLHVYRYVVASLENDAAEMSRQAQWAAGRAGVEDVLLSEQADNEAVHGHLRAARARSRRAVQLARQAGANESATVREVETALTEAEFGNERRARAGVDAALKLARTRDVEALAAFVLARVGSISEAKTIGDDLARRFPADIQVQHYWLPAIRAAIELDNNHPSAAIEYLQSAVPYELGVLYFTAEWAAPLHPVYVRANAYLKLHQGKEAEAEYKKLIDHRDVIKNATAAVTLAHLGLARAYRLQAETEKARAAYQEFFALWKDADPDIPILQQAKAEYAKLN